MAKSPKKSNEEKLSAELTALIAADPVEVNQAFVVIQMSNNGPYDVRAITVDDRHAIQPTSTTQARAVFDISALFHPPARIGWWIVAGVQFPKAGVFLVRPNEEPELLEAQQPLKKGVAWVGEKVVG
jgi:hypothetical protein